MFHAEFTADSIDLTFDTAATFGRMPVIGYLLAGQRSQNLLF